MGVLDKLGITTIEELSRVSVLDLFLMSCSLQDERSLSSIRSEGMSTSLETRRTMSFLPICATIDIEKHLRKNGAEYVTRLFSLFQNQLPGAMRIQLFVQSLKANLIGRGYSFSEKFGIVAYGNINPHPTSILLAKMKELDRPLSKSEAKDLLDCSIQTIQNYIKDEPGIIVNLSNGHYFAPELFAYSNVSEKIIVDFLETSNEFVPENVQEILEWKSFQDISRQELKSQSDIRLYIDEFIRRNRVTGWVYNEEEDCYFFEEDE